jgi:hypothetical protein
MYIKDDIGFIAHPKTGSTSAMTVLEGELGFEKRGQHHEWRQPWLDGLRVRAATVRNPWDVMVSWYFHKGCDGKGPFEQWLPVALHRNDYIRRGLFFALPHANFILRFEDLDNDWKQFLKLAGLPHVDLPKKNVGRGRNGRHYREFYGPASRDLVALAFATEIEQLEYTF